MKVVVTFNFSGSEPAVNENIYYLINAFDSAMLDEIHIDIKTSATEDSGK